MMENDLTLRRMIRDCCIGWPDEIGVESIRKCHLGIAPSLPFIDFAVEFEIATGFEFGKPCRRRMSYEDPTIKNVAIDLLMNEKVLIEETIKTDITEEDDPNFPFLLDARYEMSQLIFLTLNNTNLSLGRICNEAQLKEMVHKIASSIPFSRRWMVFVPSRANTPTLNKYYSSDFKNLSQTEMNRLNIFEDDSIGWIATYAVDEELKGSSEYLHVFQSYSQSIGLNDFTEYKLPLHVDPSYYDDPTTIPYKLATSGDVMNYAKWMKVDPSVLTLTSQDIFKLKLDKLPISFIPIFYQIRESEPQYVAAYNMIEANNVARLSLFLW